jgi:hypothetical protein
LPNAWKLIKEVEEFKMTKAISGNPKETRIEEEAK